MNPRYSKILWLGRKNEEPLIDQGSIGIYDLSWNPDDERFYVTLPPHETVATFTGDIKGFSNMVQFARRKNKEHFHGQK